MSHPFLQFLEELRAAVRSQSGVMLGTWVDLGSSLCARQAPNGQHRLREKRDPEERESLISATSG